MSDDQIRYDVLTQEALRGVIKKVLDEVVVAGLPGEHHFFITFNTTYPGVRLSKAIKERYPESMTIVIQHTFWNLKTSDTDFELDLTFNDIKEHLKIPFAAVQAFFDPSVKFGLQFDLDEETADQSADILAIDGAHSDSKTNETSKEAAQEPDPETDQSEDENEEPKADASGEIVSLDAFRNKK